ncbi:MAG: type III polyketide synthase [Planctomycetota bacterium]
MTHACIHSIGCANPPQRLTRAQWIEMASLVAPKSLDRAVILRLAERSGIDGRWCASAQEVGKPAFFQADPDGYGPTTSQRMQLWASAARQMSTQACLQAIDRAQISARAITHIVTASCTGFEAPGLDAWLIENLSLSPDCRRTNVGFMGCHAAVNALSIARDVTLANPDSVVLVCCTEISSAHLHYGARLDQLIANTLFSDGSAAVIVARGDPDALPCIAGTHSILMPESASEMAWHIGDHGFEMTLGARVPEIIESRVGEWARNALAKHSLKVEDIRGWAIHPGGPRVIDAVIASLAIANESGDASRCVLQNFGNMSSATLLFILSELLERKIARPWVGLAFGPGLAGEMLVVE